MSDFLIPIGVIAVCLIGLGIVFVIRYKSSRPFLVFGGLIGIVAAFLPLLWTRQTDFKLSVLTDWRGKLCVVCYIAALVLAFVLYPPTGKPLKALCWVGVAVGLVVLGLASWLLMLALEPGSVQINFPGLGKGGLEVGFGAFFNVLAGAAVTAGGLMKAREETLL